MTGSGLSESRSGFRPRAGTLTLLFLASDEDRETLVAMLAHLDAALLDPLADPDDWDLEPDEEEGEDEEVDEEDEYEDDDEGEWEDDRDRDDLERTLPSFGEGPPPPRSGISIVHPGIGPAIGPHAALGLDQPDAELLYVGYVLQRWLRKSPVGPLRLGEEESGIALAALVSGWSSTVTHALSGAAPTMEELEGATGAVRPEVLAARVDSMVDVGLLDPLEGAAGETRYAATRWLRQGIAALAAAARYERRQEDEDTAPPDVLDVGAAFLLTLPLLELPADLSGTCRLAVQLPGDAEALTGATAHVENGHVVFVDLRLDPTAPSSATASPLGWLDTLVEPDAEEVEFGGDARLAEAIVEGLHETLFGDP